MKIGTKKSQKCPYCGVRFEVNARGRPRRYCRPSHRVRAFEKRKELESRQPREKQYRLLREWLESLQIWRRRSGVFPGLDEIRRFAGLPRRKNYQRAVEGVRNILMGLAPELFQEEERWRMAVRDLEANAAIERNEQIQRGTPRN